VIYFSLGCWFYP